MAKLDAAIRDCLAECGEAGDRYERQQRVAVYLLTLRADAGWTEEEVRQVEYAVSGARRAERAAHGRRGGVSGIAWSQGASVGPRLTG